MSRESREHGLLWKSQTRPHAFPVLVFSKIEPNMNDTRSYEVSPFRHSEFLQKEEAIIEYRNCNARKFPNSQRKLLIYITTTTSFVNKTIDTEAHFATYDKRH